MKKQNYLVTILAFALFSFYGTLSVQAQANSPHVFHVNTWYMAQGIDSVGRAERNAILEEYLEKVTKKNNFVLHQWAMTHFFSEDSREFVTITEYASFADIEKAFDRDDELAQQAWPDAKKREEFMKKMSSYFTYHKDAIYNGFPKQVK